MPIGYLDSGLTKDNDRVKSLNYWDGGIPGTLDYGYQKDDVGSEYLSQDWFLEGDQFRYKNYKFLEGFCEYDKYNGKKILDIGPGRGQETHNFIRKGNNLTVLEFARQGCELLAERRDAFNLSFDLFQGDAISMPFEDETFDLVFSYGVLHHIPEIEKSISEVSRVTKKGGEVKLMLYHKGYFYYKTMLIKWYLLKGNFLKYSWRDYIKIAMEQREGPCPVVYIYSMGEIESLFSNTDLKIKSYFNAEIIDGRLVKYGIIPSWFIKKYRDILGAYCHITLVRE